MNTATVPTNSLTANFNTSFINLSQGALSEGCPRRDDENHQGNGRRVRRGVEGRLQEEGPGREGAESTDGRCGRIDKEQLEHIEGMIKSLIYVQSNLHTSCAEILHESQGLTVERLSRADGSICRRQIAIIALTGSCSIGGNFVCTVNIPEVCLPSIMVESCVPHQTMVVPLIIILFLYICALDSQSFLEAEVYDYFGNRSVFRIW